jgi:hypothetical protein
MLKLRKRALQFPTSETPTRWLFLASFTVLTSPLIRAMYEKNDVLKIAGSDRYLPQALR